MPIPYFTFQIKKIKSTHLKPPSQCTASNKTANYRTYIHSAELFITTKALTKSNQTYTDGTELCQKQNL